MPGVGQFEGPLLSEQQTSRNILIPNTNPEPLPIPSLSFAFS